jgi:hypothetical protein
MLSDDQSGLRWLVLLALSLAVHAGTVGASLGLGLARRAPTDTKLDIPDRMGGNTFDVDAVVEAAAREPTAAPAANTEVSDAREVTEDAVPVPSVKPAPKAPSTDTKPAAVLVPAAQPPKPKITQRRPSASSSRESSNSDSQSSAATETQPSTGVGLAFGAAGLPPGVRNLPSAFTRAIPPAVSADPVWSEMPAGHVGSFRLRVELDDAGHIGDAEPVLERPGSKVPAHFLRLKQRVIALLGGGQFALKTTPGAGTQTFAIDVTLSDRTPNEDVDPRRAYNIGFDPPSAGRAGRAYFTLGSGRHFEAKVRLVN